MFLGKRDSSCGAGLLFRAVAAPTRQASFAVKNYHFKQACVFALVNVL